MTKNIDACINLGTGNFPKHFIACELSMSMSFMIVRWSSWRTCTVEWPDLYPVCVGTSADHYQWNLSAGKVSYDPKYKVTQLIEKIYKLEMYMYVMLINYRIEKNFKVGKDVKVVVFR